MNCRATCSVIWPVPPVSFTRECRKLWYTPGLEERDVMFNRTKFDLTLLAAFIITVTTAPAATSTPARARAHVGQFETICGGVASTHYSPGGRRPTFLNLDRPYPHPIFTIVIWGADRSKFGRLEGKHEIRPCA
jgi:hypothetical protein